ncbi:MAG TPA: DUF2235 domain-containing protein [Nevskia sp.]|nr:DUF2235 domain-containing protein [Nevskia sp.]
MPRNIVLCLDGTSNHYAVVNTNVVKLYAMLDRTRTDQLSYYQPGIGTIAPAAFWGRVRRWFVKQIDLATAWFLSDHVTDAYRFLMRYYQEGDRIYIFGFSRGAYTARAVAAMVHKVGLLTQGNDELISFAWDMFAKQTDKVVYEGFKQTFSREVPVYFLGLWDTVSSVGWVWDPKHLPYTQNNPSVQIVRHAVALDERRAYFVQNLWGTVPTDVEQLWFPGVHCDVGGGYTEDKSGLSAIALQWMVEKAAAAGLIIDPQMKAIMLPAQNTPEGYAAPYAGGPANESLTGLWWIPEFIPKRFYDPAANFAKRWMIHAGRRRFVRPDAGIHPSVYERKTLVPGYHPPNLPPQPPQRA